MTDDNLQAKLGNRVRDLRAQLGVGQEDFARMIGMDRSYYASIETGRRNVTLKMLAKIADGFGITLSEPFDGL